jgi:hypothetical protein
VNEPCEAKRAMDDAASMFPFKPAPLLRGCYRFYEGKG